MKRIFWISRDKIIDKVDLWKAKPQDTVTPGVYNSSNNSMALSWFCAKSFQRLTGVKIKAGQVKEIKIDIKETKT